MVEIRYLGVAGWQFIAGGTSVVLDPYFTRIPYLNVVLGRVIPDVKRIAAQMPHADAIFVTHPHYDHLMDVPEAARIAGAQVWASPQGCALLRVLGLTNAQICDIKSGASIQCGLFCIEVYESRHRKVFGSIPYLGPLRSGLRPPLRAADYRMDSQFSFRITAEDVSILVTSGIDEEPAVHSEVLLVGADATSEQLARIMEPCQPRIVMPNHWDDMFRPMSNPARPMIVPPPTRIPSFKRIDLEAWSIRVHQIKPEAQVIIPRYFEPIDLLAIQ